MKTTTKQDWLMVIFVIVVWFIFSACGITDGTGSCNANEDCHAEAVIPGDCGTDCYLE